MNKEQRSKRLAEALEAIRNGEQVIVKGDSKYGDTRLTPGSLSFATMFSPDRTWDEPSQNYKVRESPVGPMDEGEVRSYLIECLDHDEITVSTKEYEA